MDADAPASSGTAWRCFFALEIGAAVRAALDRCARRLAREAPGLRLVPAANLHLTLLFLGDVPAERVPGLRARADEAAVATPPFAFDVAGLGAFGPPGSPRVVWAGLADPPAELPALHGRLAAACRAAGCATGDRPFHPHLTLARLRPGARPAALTSGIESGIGTPFGRVDVRRVLLLRSELRPAGPVYTALHESPLQGG